jgi:phage terminase large subunit GpA-like protein
LTVVKTRRGFQKLEWQKMRERNEALDCRVYARAAAWILGADRWSEKVWRDLEAQFPSRKPAKRETEQHGDGPEALAPTRAAAPVPKRRGRSVRRSSWMG